MKSAAESYRRFLDGDNSGLTEIIRIYSNSIMLYLNGMVHDIHLAEELTEETFVKLVLKRPKIHKDHAFKTWLYTVAGNVARDYLRRNKGRLISIEECFEIEDDVELEKNYIVREQNDLLHKAMKKLKPEYRQILWLIYFEEFSVKEAARIMGKSTHNAETMAYRARRVLKEIMLQEGYEYEKP